MPRGGKRPGAGIKRGFKYPKTLEKERVLAACRELVMREAEKLFGAQIEHAKGIEYLVLRRDDGTYARATEEKQIQAWIDSGGTLGKLMTQAPNVQAFTALMDRTFDKPRETQDLNISGTIDIAGLLAKRHRKSEPKG